MHNSKSVETSIEKGSILSRDEYPNIGKEKNHMTKAPHRKSIGNLMYAMFCTRLDFKLLLEWLADSSATRDLLIGKV